MHNTNLPGHIQEQNVTKTTYSVQSSGLPQTYTQTRETITTTGAPLNNLTGQTGIMSGHQNVLNHHKIGNTGVGTITFRPIEGRFVKDKDIVGKMDPYCKFKIGWRSGKSSVAKSEGTHPTWVGDAITLKVKNQEFAKLKIKDKDRLRLDDRLGSAQIPLAQVIQQGAVSQWIPVSKNGVATGEVHVEMVFTPKVVGL